MGIVFGLLLPSNWSMMQIKRKGCGNLNFLLEIFLTFQFVRLDCWTAIDLGLESGFIEVWDNDMLMWWTFGCSPKCVISNTTSFIRKMHYKHTQPHSIQKLKKYPFISKATTHKKTTSLISPLLSSVSSSGN